MKILIGRDDLSAVAVGAATAALPAAEVEAVRIRPVHNASKQFVNDSAIDVCELAIVTLLQAVAFGKPVLMLPITALGRFQHQTLVTCKGLSIDQIPGKSIGVRAWSQTTGVWVRGFLTEQYGIGLRDVDWIAYEDGHIAEYQDPSWVRRAASGMRLADDFLAGRVDFAILGNELPEGKNISTAIPGADAAGADWAAEAGFVPVNHVLGVSARAAREHAAAICGIYDALSAELAAERSDGPVDLVPVGFQALRGPIDRAAKFAFEQEILPRSVEFDELVSATCRAGVGPERLAGG